MEIFQKSSVFIKCQSGTELMADAVLPASIACDQFDNDYLFDWVDIVHCSDVTS